jgi:hypothetical protein
MKNLDEVLYPAVLKHCGHSKAATYPASCAWCRDVAASLAFAVGEFVGEQLKAVATFHVNEVLERAAVECDVVAEDLSMGQVTRAAGRRCAQRVRALKHKEATPHVTS